MQNGFSLPQVEGPQYIKDVLCNTVRKEVQDAFGHTIASARDCNRLSEEIYLKTSFKVNPNTLRRFFGLVKAQYPPSLSTLTILANYCGYHSLDELSAMKSKCKAGKDMPDEKRFLHYLVSLFTTMPKNESSNDALFTFINHTISFISKWPEMANQFQRAIAKTKSGQSFYFELFINIDKLNSFYGEGLRHYLNETKTVEGQIFGYSLLCLRDWLTLDYESLKRNFLYVQKLGLRGATEPSLFGIYISAHLVYAEAFKLEMHNIMVEVYKKYSSLKHSLPNRYLYKSLEYYLANALVWTKNYQDAMYFIKEALSNYPERHSLIDQSCYSRLMLLKAVAYAQGGINDEAEKLFGQLRPSQFSFLTKKTDTILYLSLARCLKKNNKKLDRQLEALIEETGFLRFRMTDVGCMATPSHLGDYNSN